ncbi:MAG: NERD domain-containing protein [Erysipelotrichaceae bacterium]|jgi:hypothetical protein|nr:NERD domain-containing protein [Erysipelotrichaceae bacterium]
MPFEKQLVIICISIFIAVMTVLIVLNIFRALRYKKNYKIHYAKMLYRLAIDYDYYLINNVLLPLGYTHVFRIDHILASNKYIFLIKDYKFTGHVEGKENDESWTLTSKRKDKVRRELIDNPFNDNKEARRLIPMILGIPETSSFFISIALINDESCQRIIEGKSKYEYLVPYRYFKNLITNIEKRPEAAIDKEQLEDFVHKIAAYSKITPQKKQK